MDTAGVRFRPPVSRPSKLLCAFANYREDGAWTAVPLDIFLESPAAIIGDGDTVVLPPVEVKLNVHRRDATRGGIVARGGRPLITVWQSWDALVAHRWPRGRGGPHLAHERPLARGHGAPPSAATDLAALGHLARTTRACTLAQTQP